jgi:hypothetical protein
MAVLALFFGEGFSSDMYDALREKVGWERQYPNGAISHAASFDEGGNAHVADVWASQEALNAFVESRLAPALQALNFPIPYVDVYPLHNLNAYSGIQQYVLR